MERAEFLTSALHGLVLKGCDPEQDEKIYIQSLIRAISDCSICKWYTSYTVTKDQRTHSTFDSIKGMTENGIAFTVNVILEDKYTYHVAIANNDGDCDSISPDNALHLLESLITNLRMLTPVDPYVINV